MMGIFRAHYPELFEAKEPSKKTGEFFQLLAGEEDS